jgi:hypothetical protein
VLQAAMPAAIAADQARLVHRRAADPRRDRPGRRGGRDAAPPSQRRGLIAPAVRLKNTPPPHPALSPLSGARAPTPSPRGSGERDGVRGGAQLIHLTCVISEHGERHRLDD